MPGEPTPAATAAATPAPPPHAARGAAEPLLSVEQLHVQVGLGRRGTAPRTVVRDVTLELQAGQTLGLVGESGSGKSMTVKSVLGLLPPGAAVAGGRVRFRGEDVAGFDRRRTTRYRAHDVAMIHQDPRASINPLWTVGDFLVEGVLATGQMRRDEAVEAACTLMRDVGIRDADRRMQQHPHQLSGGLLQRVMIVSALLPSPSLILADEPTTALDVTVQSDVMAILAEQIEQREVGLLFITHDLDLAAAVTDQLAVMYAGTIVETGGADAVVERPSHPYTAALLASRPDPTTRRTLVTIPGRPASAAEVGPGCGFVDRCSLAVGRCRTERPVLRPWRDRKVACHRVEELHGSTVLPV